VPAAIALFNEAYITPVNVATPFKVTERVVPSPITKLSDISIIEFTGIVTLKRTVSMLD
jgi:hypothetical protein